MNDHELDERVAATAPTVPDLSRVDLYDAQQELLAEISRHERGRRRPLAAALVAAAVVLVLAVVPAVLMGGRADRDGRVSIADGPGFTTQAVRSAAAGPRLLLDVPGWRLQHLDAGSMSFHRGRPDTTRVVPGGLDRVPHGQDLEIGWYPATAYSGYRRHRAHVGRPREIHLLGTTGRMVTYSRGDYAVLTPPAHGTFLEIRGSGLSGRAAFGRLLRQLRQVDAMTWLRSLPPSVTVPTDDGAATAALLEGVPTPPGVTTSDLTPKAAATFYPYAADVTGAVVCGWIADYRSGDAAERARAVSALESSKDWRVLHRMDSHGDWPEVVWETADEVKAGHLRTSAAYHGSLGCDE